MQENNLNGQENITTEIDLIIRSAQELKEIKVKQEDQEKRLSLLEAKSEKTSGDTGYFTIKAWCRLNNIKFPLEVLRKKGYEASRISRENGIYIGKKVDETFGTVNCYREDILEEIFGTVQV